MGITRIALPKKGEVHSYFIAGDWHSYHLHKATYKILIKAALKLPKKQRRLVINGDFLDAVHLMKKGEGFKKWIKRPEGLEDYFIPESEKEFLWANEMLDHLQKVFPLITFIEGNHDARYSWFMKNLSSGAYRHNFCIVKNMNLISRDISVVKSGSWLDLGKLSITHGQFHGVSAVKRHYEASGGRSVIFGHVHKLECKPFVSRGETRQGWSTPALCKLNPEYMGIAENNWSNGFALVHMKHNGNFNLNVFQVWDDELIWPDGRVIKGE